MVKTEEGTHRLEDGTELYTKTWKPDGPPVAIVAFIHGFSDHCNAYRNFFTRLAARGIQVHGFDQRGWGRSITTPSSRGASGPTTLVLADMTSFLTPLLTSPTPSPPLFLLGASMGGAQVLHYASYGPRAIRTHIRGYIAEAPLIALHPSSRPWRLTVALGRLAARVVPKAQMRNHIPEVNLSRDEGVRAELRADGLCHDMGTLEGMAGMLHRAGALEGGEVRVRDEVGEGGAGRKSVLVTHGTGDVVTDAGASREFVERMEVRDKEFRAYEGWFHQLHREPGECSEIYATDVAGWILARCETGNGSAVSKPKL